MNNIFENKEDYLKLVNFWKQFHADKKYKSVKVMSYDNTNFRMVSPLELHHHVIYLAATGKSLDKAFKKATIETLSKIRWLNGKYFLDKQFKLFGDAIDEKYHTKIQEKIEAFVKQRNA